MTYTDSYNKQQSEIPKKKCKIYFFFYPLPHVIMCAGSVSKIQHKIVLGRREGMKCTCHFIRNLASNLRSVCKIYVSTYREIIEIWRNYEQWNGNNK